MTDVTHLRPGANPPTDRVGAALPTLNDLITVNRQVASYAAAQDRARNLPDLPKPHALVAGQAQRWRDRALWQRGHLLSTPLPKRRPRPSEPHFRGRRTRT